MELAKSLKSKKVAAGVGVVAVILVGFFMLKFMTSGGEEAVPEKPRTAHRATRKTPKPKKEEQEKSPLFEAMEALKDPFRTEDPKAAELQDKLDLTKKEIEYLKATLEEKKLRQEIREIEKSLTKGEQSDMPEGEAEIFSSPRPKEDSDSEKRVVVKAILITDDQRSALLVSGDKKTWVHQGEQFDGWEIKEIREESVVAWRNGQTFVFFYDRPAITREGES
jgi:hypothetical protein